MKRKRKLKRRRQAVTRQCLQERESPAPKKVYGESPLVAGLAQIAVLKKLEAEILAAARRPVSSAVVQAAAAAALAAISPKEREDGSAVADRGE